MDATASLSTVSPYMDILEPSIALGDIEAGADFQASFPINIDKDCPFAQNVKFNLNIESPYPSYQEAYDFELSFPASIKKGCLYGGVMDVETNIPLESAHIKTYQTTPEGLNMTIETSSDNEGYFRIDPDLESNSPGVSLSISKDSFETLVKDLVFKKDSWGFFLPVYYEASLRRLKVDSTTIKGMVYDERTDIGLAQLKVTGTDQSGNLKWETITQNQSGEKDEVAYEVVINSEEVSQDRITVDSRPDYHLYQKDHQITPHQENIIDIPLVENEPPVAVISSAASEEEGPLEVVFNSQDSYDPDPINGDEKSLDYTWDFGDGSPASLSPSPAHFYKQPGVYNVSLLVRDKVADGIGKWSEPAEQTLNLSEAAENDDPIYLDPEINGLVYTYRIPLSEDVYITGGKTLSRLVFIRGLLSAPEYHLRVEAGYSGDTQTQEEYRLQINDSAKLGNIIPDQNDDYYSSDSQHYEWIDHDDFGDHNYIVQNLKGGENKIAFHKGDQPSDTANSVHFRTIEITCCPITYTLTMAVNPSEGGTTDPPVGNHTYDANTVVPISAIQTDGYTFINWTGDVEDPQSTTVTMDRDKTVTANFALPDLTFTSLNIDSPKKEGDEIEVDAEYKNIDRGRAKSGFRIKMEVYDEGGILKDTEFSPYLAALDAKASAPCHFVVPEDKLAAGKYTVTLTVDPNNDVVKESNETNNQISGALEISPIIYTLTMAVNPSEGGTTDPLVGNHTYDAGEVVDITATLADGYTFMNWTGDVADAKSADTTVTMNNNKKVIANFSLPDLTFTSLTIDSPKKEGDEIKVDAEYKNIDRGRAKSGFQIKMEVYDDKEGTLIYTDATPHWLAAVDAGASALCHFTIPGDKLAAGNYTVTLTVDPNNDVVKESNETNNQISGTLEISPIIYTLTMIVKPSGGGTTDPAVGSYTYNAGTVVPISAIPADGYTFMNWSLSYYTGDGVADPNSAITTVTMNGNKIVTANFGQPDLVAIPHKLAVYKHEDLVLFKGPEPHFSEIPVTEDVDTYVYKIYNGETIIACTGVKNIGNVNAGPSQSGLYAQLGSDVNIISSNLKGTYPSRALTPGDYDYYVEITWKPPSKGLYSLCVKVDYDNKVNESDEGNNLTRRVFLNVLNNPPEAKILSIDPNPAFADKTVTFTGEVTDPDGDNDISYVKWDFGDGSTTTGDLSDEIVTHTYAKPGTYTVTLEAGDKNGDKDTDTATVEVKIALPDLTFTSLTVPSPQEEGKDIKIDATYENIGLGEIQSPADYKIRLEVIKQGSVVYEYITETLSALRPGESAMFTHTIPGDQKTDTDTRYKPQLPAGTYTVILKVDYADVLPESDETNNEISGTLEISPIIYTLTMIVKPSGGGTTDPAVGSYTYNAGTVVPISAIPADGYTFMNWSLSYYTGDGVADPNSAITTVTMNGNKIVTANFGLILPDLIVSYARLEPSTIYKYGSSRIEFKIKNIGLAASPPSWTAGCYYMEDVLDFTDITHAIRTTPRGRPGDVVCMVSLSPLQPGEETGILTLFLYWQSSFSAKSYCVKVMADIEERIIESDETNNLSAPQILTPPAITVTSPNGGENWKVGNNQIVTWTSSGTTSGNVKIEYSIDAGSTWSEIISSTPDNDSYPWTIPQKDDFPSNQCLIKVSDAANPGTADQSDNTFTIWSQDIYVDDNCASNPIKHGSKLHPFGKIQDEAMKYVSDYRTTINLTDIIYIHVLAGTYDENVALTSHVQLLGENKTNTTIQSSQAIHTITIGGAIDILIKGFTIINNSGDTSVNSINITGVTSYITIEDNSITRTRSGGSTMLHLHSGAGIMIYYANHITIQYNTISDCFNDGIINYGSNNKIENNTISGCKCNGIYNNGINVTIKSNTISDIGGSGSYHASENGIHNNASINTTIQLNKISNCKRDGINNLNSYNSTIESNTIYDCKGLGIDISGDNVNVRYNDIKNIEVGIGCQADYSNVDIYYNLIIDASLTGIKMEKSTNAEIINNTIITKGDGIFIGVDSQNINIKNSIIWISDPNYGCVHNQADVAQVEVSYTDLYAPNGDAYANTYTKLYSNMRLNPLFKGPDDYHLQSILNGDSHDSPCIDTGDPNDPPDSANSRIDRGCYTGYRR